MFLKRLLIALLIANIGYFAYAQGWLGNLMGGDTLQREPQRLAKQINPELLNVSFAPEAAPTLAPTPAVAMSCNPDAGAVEQWLVYMGPYASKDMLDKKKAELQRLGVTSSEVSKTSLPRGLALGSFPSEDLARASWLALQGRGIKTATVILWSTPSKDKTC